MRLFVNKRPLAIAVGLLAATSLHSPTGFAQAAALEEVVVTAQRRAESLQDVPVTITAINQDQLEFQQIDNVGDIQLLVPNISMATNTGLSNGARIFLRGIGEDDSRVTIDPAVSMYLDDVYVGRQIGALFDLVDVERIEVLRGPQGTLYGRNSNGGAIKIHSRKPDTEANALMAKLTVGNERRKDMKVSGNLAISNNTALQFSLLDRERDGLYDVIDGAGNKLRSDVGEWNTRAARLAGLFRSGNGIEFQLSYDKIRDKSDPLPATIPRDFELSLGRDGDIYTIEQDFISLVTGGDSTSYDNRADQEGLALTVSGNFNDHDWKYLGSRRTLDNDVTTVIIGQYSHEVEQEQISHEFQVSSDFSGAFNYVAGLFYFKEDVDQDYSFFGPTSLAAETTAVGAFGQAFYDISDAWRFTGGVRYTSEDKELTGVNLSQNFQGDEDFSNTDYKLVLDYNLNENVMLFGSFTTGFKSGGWSPDNFDVVEEETVETIELGAKSEFFERKLRVNLTVFQNSYEDLQLNGTVQERDANGNPVGAPFFTRYNVPEVESSGVEVDVTWLVSSAFRLYGNVGYLDGEYKKLDPKSLDIIGDKGNDLKNAPQWSVTVGGDYLIDIGAAGSLTAGLDIALEDESYNLVNNPELQKRENTTLVNARLVWESNSEQFRVALWGKNLGDEEYYPAASAPFWVYAADPRTYGVDFTYRM